MRIVQIDGGLGNQMFQYVFYQSLKRNYPRVYINLDVVKKSGQHQGYELNKIFQIKSQTNVLTEFVAKLIQGFQRSQSRDYKILTGLISRVLKFLHIKFIYEESFSVYSEQYLNAKGFILYYKGYWQSELYFKDKTDVLNIFRFTSEMLNSQTRDFQNVIFSKQNTVSVHIRRGDYLAGDSVQMFGNICTMDYYRKAIDFIISKLEESVIIIFSDDIDWVKDNLSISNSVFVDWNTGHDSWQDMFLMSICKHNIIANSSFSWWGAYLNDNPDKIVVAPKKWHNLHSAPDICPKEWIRL